eukprot:1770824-Alexandrium_andersonii.AAC.1
MTVGPPPPPCDLQGLGVVKRFVGSLGSQTSAVELIDGAKQSIRVMAFTWDRQDITEALVRARARNVPIRMG